MTYVLGVDLGTAYTAAATLRDGRVEIASLGNQGASIPSVILLKEDESILTGEAANRRSIVEPSRVAREFKRRVGDTTPIFVGGVPQSAEALMARLLRWVAAEVASQEGGPAEHLAVCHPANWGPWKKDLLSQAVRIADLGVATFLTEPEAAAIYYTSRARVDLGEIVAVYDLGGGTFDAAILKRTADGFEILGEPEGIERLGGIDFDAAVFAHVVRSLDGKLEELDEDDQASISAVARLRQDCVEAKEALSSDTDVSIPVMLPNIQTELRLTRTEFEAMIRPSLTDSLGAMRRALASANLEPSDIATVLLVGGSSRIPLVSQMVSAELGRPVAVDTHPKHAVALGAALAAGAAAGLSGLPTAAPAAPAAAAPPVPPTPDAPPPPAAAAPPETPAAVVPPAPVTPQAPVAPQPPAPAADVAPAPAAPPQTPVEAPAPEPAPQAPLVAEPPPTKKAASDDGPNRALIGAGIVALVVVVAIGIALFMGGGDNAEPEADGSTDTTEVPTVAAAATAVPEEVPDEPEEVATAVPEEVATAVPEEPSQPEEEVATAVPATPVPEADAAQITQSIMALAATSNSVVDVAVDGDTVALTGRAFDPAAMLALTEAAEAPGVAVVLNGLELQTQDEQCSQTVQGLQNWACLVSATYDGELVRATYSGSPQEGAAAWSTDSLHLHVFGSNNSPSSAGSAGPYSDGTGSWKVWADPTTFEGTLTDIGSSGGVPDKLCVRVANQVHTLESLDSGNCWPITDLTG